MKTGLISDSLPSNLEADLRSLNPWWMGKPGVSVPIYRRWVFASMRRSLSNGLTPALVVKGPRRVGKTVLLRQIIEALLSEGVEPRRIMYVAFDELSSLAKLSDPILSICRWFEQSILGQTFNESAKENRRAILLLDEIQNLVSWAPQLKHLVDNHEVRVIVTGSSSLRIEGGRDSLAGRIRTVELGPLNLREIAGIRFSTDLPPFWGENHTEDLVRMEFWQEAVEHANIQAKARKQAFVAYSERGAYPDAQQRADVSWPEMADHLNETIIKRAIEHDLRMGERGIKRDRSLLEEVFRLCCRYAGQAPGQSMFIPEIHQSLDNQIGWNRIINYLRFLDGAMLIRLIQPLEIRLKKKKSASKICLCDLALRAAWLQEVVPLHPEGLAANPHLTDLAGHLAESALGYYLGTIPNLGLSWFPERSTEPEVDFVLTVGTKKIPIEVKYRHRIDPFDDTRGLRAFIEKSVYNAPFGLLVTLNDDVRVPDPRIIPISLSALLWMR